MKKQTRILVVDDHAIVRNSLAAFLSANAEESPSRKLQAAKRLLTLRQKMTIPLPLSTLNSLTPKGQRCSTNYRIYARRCA